MKYLVLLCALVTLCGATVRPTSFLGTTSRESSFSALGAALSESVGPDGTRQGECAFSDSDGTNIKVRFLIRPNSDPRFEIVEGNSGSDPAAAYESCIEAYKRSQANSASFIMPNIPLPVFPTGFPFNFNNNPFLNFRSGVIDGGFPQASRIADEVHQQNMALLEQNLALQENMRRLERQNLELQNKLNQRIKV